MPPQASEIRQQRLPRAPCQDGARSRLFRKSPYTYTSPRANTTTRLFLRSKSTRLSRRRSSWRSGAPPERGTDSNVGFTSPQIRFLDIDVGSEMSSRLPPFAFARLSSRRECRQKKKKKTTAELLCNARYSLKRCRADARELAQAAQRARAHVGFRLKALPAAGLLFAVYTCAQGEGARGRRPQNDLGAFLNAV